MKYAHNSQLSQPTSQIPVLPIKSCPIIPTTLFKIKKLRSLETLNFYDRKNNKKDWPTWVKVQDFIYNISNYMLWNAIYIYIYTYVSCKKNMWKNSHCLSKTICDLTILQIERSCAENLQPFPKAKNRFKRNLSLSPRLNQANVRNTCRNLQTFADQRFSKIEGRYFRPFFGCHLQGTCHCGPGNIQYHPIMELNQGTSFPFWFLT